MNDKGAVLEGLGVEGGLCLGTPWPGIARTLFQDHDRSNIILRVTPSYGKAYRLPLKKTIFPLYALCGKCTWFDLDRPFQPTENSQ